MKTEVQCGNPACASYGSPKLRSVHRLRGSNPVDEDGESISCADCDSPLRVLALARTEAQFALGPVEVTPAARESLGESWWEIAADLLREHNSGRHGWIKANTALVNISGEGAVISRYIVYDKTIIVIVTDEGKTVIQPEWEYELR